MLQIWLAELSAIIPNSVGPASISIPVWSLTKDLAVVTNAPGPTIFYFGDSFSTIW